MRESTPAPAPPSSLVTLATSPHDNLPSAQPSVREIVTTPQLRVGKSSLRVFHRPPPRPVSNRRVLSPRGEQKPSFVPLLARPHRLYRTVFNAPRSPRGEGREWKSRYRGRRSVTVRYRTVCRGTRRSDSRERISVDRLIFPSSCCNADRRGKRYGSFQRR